MQVCDESGQEKEKYILSREISFVDECISHGSSVNSVSDTITIKHPEKLWNLQRLSN